MNKVLIISPHPDDESLGCGGSILRHISKGHDVYWLVCTEVDSDFGWEQKQIKKRESEISKVRRAYGFKKYFNLKLPSSKLDDVPIQKIIKSIRTVVNQIEPNAVYIPFSYDVHTDHQIISKVFTSFIKWFRYPSINTVLMYETLSETNFNFSSSNNFTPNIYVDISQFIQKKIKICKIYESEIKPHPFPRSTQSINALSIIRGSEAGFEHAEAFQLVLKREV